MLRLFTDPNRRGIWVLLIVIAVLVLIVLWLAGEARADTPAGESWRSVEFEASTEEQAIAMIEHWIGPYKKHAMRNKARQRRFASLQVEATEEHGTPLSLTMAIMFRESSCKTEARGTRGEIGLMQVHPDTARTFRCQTKTPAGQIDCGHRVLARGFGKCQTWAGAMTFYAGKRGRCKARPGSRLAWVVKDRLKFAAELEEIAR